MGPPKGEGRLGTLTEVHVWSAGVDRPEYELAWFSRLLTPEERARADRYRFAGARDRFVVRRALRRWVLARYLGADPATIVFTAGTHGKPELADEGDLRFSESESCGLALIAVARGAEVGVDVERVRPVNGAEQIVERFGTPAEREAYERLGPEDRHRGFLRWWTAKEALVKALGSGLDDRLASLGLEPGWCRTELRIGPHHVGCVVTEGHNAAVTRMLVDGDLQAEGAS